MNNETCRRKLLQVGALEQNDPWPDYVKLLHLSPDDAPELLVLVQDVELHHSESDVEFWTPIHAWRALAQMREPEVFAAMLFLIEQEDNLFAFFEFPKAAALIGKKGLPILLMLLKSDNTTDLGITAIINALEAIAKNEKDQHESVSAVLEEKLVTFRENTLEINAYLAKALVGLRAKSSLSTIKNAFLEQQVDLSILSWAEVETALTDDEK